MSFSTLNTELFKAISGENGRKVLALLLELDTFLDPAQLEREPTPQQTRNFLRDYISNTNLRLEAEQGEEISAGTAPEQYIYSRLKSTGWLREEQEAGYRYVVWMAQDGRRILHFLNTMMAEHPSLGMVCLGVRLSLLEALKDPARNGSLVRKAADDMDGFLNRFRALVGNIREIHHTLSDTAAGKQNLERYFNEYLGELFLPNMEKLALKGNPNLHESKIRKLAAELRFSQERLAACARAYKQQDISNASSELVEADLDRLVRALEGINPLFQKTQDYARRIANRTKESMKYLVATPSDFGRQVESVMDRLAGAPGIEWLPSPLIEEEMVSEVRLAQPKTKPKPASPTLRKQQKPLWEKRAYSQLAQEHIQFQQPNLERLQRFLEAQLGARTEITSDDLRIETADDMLAALHLRLLAQGVSQNHVFKSLERNYLLEFDADEWSVLPQLAGIRIKIRRRPEQVR